MNKLLLPVTIVLLTVGCGLGSSGAHEHGDVATPVPLIVQGDSEPSVAAAAYAAALFAGEPTDPWSTPRWEQELAIRPGRTTPASVLVTGTAVETTTVTSAEIIVTTNPPEAQLRVLLVLRSGAWRVRGHA